MKSIVHIYQTVKFRLGHDKAHRTIMGIMGQTLEDLDREGIEVTDKVLAERIMKIAIQFAEASDGNSFLDN